MNGKGEGERKLLRGRGGRGKEWGSPTHYFRLKSCTGKQNQRHSVVGGDSNVTAVDGRVVKHRFADVLRLSRVRTLIHHQVATVDQDSVSGYHVTFRQKIDYLLYLVHTIVDTTDARAKHEQYLFL